MGTTFGGITDAVNQILAVLFTLCSGVDKRTEEGAQKRQSVIDEMQKLIGEFGAPKWIQDILNNDAILGVVIDMIVGLLNKTTADEKALPFIEVARKVGFLVDTIVQLKEAELGSGTGAAKKDEAVKALQSMLSGLNLPAWALIIFANSVVLGVLVDVTVGTLNKIGIFGKN